MIAIIITAAMVLFLAVICIFILFMPRHVARKGRQVNAKVLSCEQKLIGESKNIYGTSKYYLVKVEFYGLNGESIVRTLTSKKQYEPEAVICCRYMEKTGLLLMDETEPETKKKTRNSVLLFLFLLIIFAACIIIKLWGMNSGYELPKESNLAVGYIISILFMGIGIWGIYKKNQMPQNMQNMISVSGVQTDYAETYDYSLESIYRLTIYHPIYEYEWGGEKKQFYSRVSGSRKKYRTIGRKVHILVNPQTGEVMCYEDEKTAGKVYFLFGAIGIAVFVLMLVLSFK